MALSSIVLITSGVGLQIIGTEPCPPFAPACPGLTAIGNGVSYTLMVVGAIILLKLAIPRRKVLRMHR